MGIRSLIPVNPRILVPSPYSTILNTDKSAFVARFLKLHCRKTVMGNLLKNLSVTAMTDSKLKSIITKAIVDGIFCPILSN